MNYQGGTGITCPLGPNSFPHVSYSWVHGMTSPDGGSGLFAGADAVVTFAPQACMGSDPTILGKVALDNLFPSAGVFGEGAGQVPASKVLVEDPNQLIGAHACQDSGKQASLKGKRRGAKQNSTGRPVLWRLRCSLVGKGKGWSASCG